MVTAVRFANTENVGAMVEWPLVAERRPVIIVKGMIREWDSM